MFNEDIKMRYIKYKTDNVVVDKYYLPNTFSNAEKFEMDLGKDLCNFTVKEIENMYRTLDFYSYETLLNVNSIFSQYTMWCINEGLVSDSQNHYMEFDRPRLLNMVNNTMLSQRVVDRETIIKWCQELPNPSDAFLLLGFFEGIRNLEFGDIKRNDININNNAIYLKERDKEIIFSNTLCNYGIISSNLDTYSSLSGAMVHSVKFIESGKVIKDYPNCDEIPTEKQVKQRIRNRMSRIFKYLGINDYTSTTSIRDSGIIEFINREKKMLRINAEEYINQYSDRIKHQYNITLRKYLFLDKYRQYLE